jgi:hypothetical protein
LTHKIDREKRDSEDSKVPPARSLRPPPLQLHRRRNHGGSGGWCPPMFSDSYIARLNFIHTDHTALRLAYRSIEPPFTKPSSYASELLLKMFNATSIAIS